MIAVDDRNRLGDEKNPELLFLEMPPARPKKVSEFCGNSREVAARKFPDF
jgi:hypothetical protein